MLKQRLSAAAGQRHDLYASRLRLSRGIRSPSKFVDGAQGDDPFRRTDLPQRNASSAIRGADQYPSSIKRAFTFLPLTLPALSLRSASRAMLRSTATYVE